MHYRYFMVRLQLSRDGPGELRGVVEQLGHGDKRDFDTGAVLLALLAASIHEAGAADITGPDPPPALRRSPPC